MPEYTCYLLDDEPLALHVLEKYLAKFDAFTVCGAATDPIEALTALKTLQPDLLFIDIEMPDLNGLELIGSLRHRPEIIITTAYREYAVEGFELEVLDYLVKPIPFRRFVQAIDRFLEHKGSIAPIAAAELTHLFVRADRKTLRVNFDDIRYIEGLKDYVRIVLADQKILTKTSLSGFQKSLPQGRFLRVHKSFIVARDKITAYTAHDVEIGGIEIPLGRGYKEQFLAEMG